MNDSFRKVPEELLFILFSYLDKETKLVATEVCWHWRIIIHEMSWKSISKLAKEDNAMKKDFSMLGWMEKEHELRDCKCIDLHLVPYYPFKNAAWTMSSYANFSTYSIEDEAVVFVQNKLICAETFKADYEFEDADDGKWVTNVNLYQLDLAEMFPSFKEVKKIRYEEEDLSRDEIFIMLKTYDNTLILTEVFWESLEEVKITLWNIEDWSFVCEVPLHETINGILKSKYEDEETDTNINIEVQSDIFVEVCKDVFVVYVNVRDGDDSINFKSLALFWKFDASNPAVPSLLTYSLEEAENVSDLLLNAMFLCKIKSGQPQVFALDDIRNNDTSKSWGFDVSDSAGDRRWLEGGNSKRLAVYNSRGNRLKVFNIESGECLFSIELNLINNLISDPKWNIYQDQDSLYPRGFQFYLGNLILFQPLVGYSDQSKFRYQLVILDEKASNQVLLGAQLDLKLPDNDPNGFDPSSLFIGPGSIVNRSQFHTYYWKVENSID